MIKSDFGKVEIEGWKEVVLAEFETLLVCMREELGERAYKMVLDRVENKSGKDILTKKDIEKAREVESKELAKILRNVIKGMEED